MNIGGVQSFSSSPQDLAASWRLRAITTAPVVSDGRVFVTDSSRWNCARSASHSSGGTFEKPSDVITRPWVRWDCVAMQCRWSGNTVDVTPYEYSGPPLNTSGADELLRDRNMYPAWHSG